MWKAAVNVSSVMWLIFAFYQLVKHIQGCIVTTLDSAKYKFFLFCLSVRLLYAGYIWTQMVWRAILVMWYPSAWAESLRIHSSNSNTAVQEHNGRLKKR